MEETTAPEPEQATEAGTPAAAEEASEAEAKQPQKVISFARGVPAPECLAVEELADCAETVLREDGKTVLSYGSSAGYQPLREHIGQWYGVEPSRVVVTNGALQGFVLLARRTARGQQILIEQPTYDRAIKILQETGATLRTVALDDEGITPESLEDAMRIAESAGFLYTIPTFQNPSGRTMSAERRKRIVELAGFYNLQIVEDDPYGLIRYEGEPQPSLFDLSGKTFIYSSSFSKTISPGLRVGWYILPEELAGEVADDAASTYITPVLLNQAIAYEFIRRGNFEPNLERINGLLKARRDAMLAALEKHLSGCTWTRPDGGYFIWLEFPEGTLAKDVAEKAKGVSFVPGVDFGGLPNTARLAFSFVSPEEIELGVERIAAVL
jgi:DNA-binding transcriptional MocR family regulator